MSEPSMIWIGTKNGIAGMEVDTDIRFVTAPTNEDHEAVAEPFEKAWKLTVQKLPVQTPIQTKATIITPGKGGQKQALQHVGLIIINSATRGPLLYQLHHG